MPKRPPDVIRPLLIKPHCLAHPEGSVLIAMGDTQVICTASVE
ncbi:ribonuclease PH, partial [Acinetobacter baumannii]